MAIGLWLLIGRTRRRVLRGDQVRALAVFGSAEQAYIGEIGGGSATALFGGADIDLRQASLGPEGATLDLTVAFGGIEIIVPQGWRVEISGLPLFGVWENKTRPPQDPAAPRLRLNCFILFGGAEVHN